MAKLDLKEYARRGAEARVAELTSELASIYRAFPGLRNRRAAATADSSDEKPARQRKPMTAAQKKAVSVRMRKYWASRRKAQE